MFVRFQDPRSATGFVWVRARDVRRRQQLRIAKGFGDSWGHASIVRVMTQGSAAFLEQMFEAKSKDAELGVSAMRRIARDWAELVTGQGVIDEALKGAFIETGIRVFGSLKQLEEAVAHGSSPAVKRRWSIIDILLTEAEEAVLYFTDHGPSAREMIADMQEQATERIADYAPTVNAQVQTVMSRYLRSES